MYRGNQIIVNSMPTVAIATQLVSCIGKLYLTQIITALTRWIFALSWFVATIVRTIEFEYVRPRVPDHSFLRSSASGRSFDFILQAIREAFVT